MAIWTIVPVKPLRRGKSRLSGILDENHREALNHCLLENTLETLKSIKAIEEVLVISRDPRALTLARSLGVKTVQESGTPELNQALERATLFVKRFTVNTVLIIPADIPLINTLDIEAILEMGKEPPVVVLVPDRHRHGTNAMLVSPPGMFKYCYGNNSFYKHMEIAQASGARIEICDRPSLALDLDLPEDLEMVQSQVSLLNGGALLRNDPYKESEATPMYDTILPEHPCSEAIRSFDFGGGND